MSMTSQSVRITKKGGYCTVSNEIAQAFRNNISELGLYIFLLSLPDGWEFKKSWLLKETGLGIHKLNRILAFLQNHKLLKTKQRKIKGKFAEFEMEIYDGKEFKINKLKPLFGQPCDHYRITETVSTETAHKKVKNKKVKNKKEKESTPKKSVESKKRTQCPESCDLVVSDESLEIAKSKNLSIEKVFLNFRDYAKSNGWTRLDWKSAFLKWVRSEKTHDQKQSKKNSETKSTVPFWGVGHPDYDRMYNYESKEF